MKPTANIPLFKVFMADTAAPEVTKVLNSGYIGQGTKVAEFEKQCEDFLGKNYVLTLNSGTSALHLALHLLKAPAEFPHAFDGMAAIINKWPGLQEGDEVLCTSLTCTASNFPVLANGLKIKWVDIDPETLNMDLDDLARKITPKTKVIMLVHWGGYPSNLDKVKQIQLNAFRTNGFSPVVIEDGAHSFGTKYNGQKLGNHGNIVMYSLQAIKHVTAIDGGLLVLPHKDLYDRAKLMRWYGIDRDEGRPDFRCVHANTLVKFSDGSTLEIAKIVKQKINKPIEVYDLNTDSWKQTQIKEWIKSEKGLRYFLNITTRRINKRNASIVTNDHKILTKQRGWIRADELINGELVLTSFPAPNKSQIEMLVGCLLGDGSVRTKTNGLTAVYNEGHSPKQEEYLRLKAGFLKNLGAEICFVKPNKAQKIPYGKFQLYTHSLPFFGELKELFYKNNKHKILPKEFIQKHFTMRALATWFMDDGCTYVSNSIDGLKYDCEIATNSFDFEECNFLAGLLNNFGYKTSVLQDKKVSSKNKGFRIYILRESTKKFLEDIAEYVPKSMRYKVGHRIDVKEFNPQLWEPRPATGYYDHVIIKPFKNYNKATYCLKVEDEINANFKTSAVVVHNCEKDITEWGFKFHMNDVCATVGIENLKHAKEIIGKHKANAAVYDKELADVPGVTLLTRHQGHESAFWIYSLLVERRHDFMKHMAAHGITVSQVHERNDKHTAMREYRSQLPTLDKTIGKVVAIPVGWWVTEEDRAYIVKTIKQGW